MRNFPELHTERLRLGRIRMTDLPIIVEYAGNKNISDNTLNLPYPYTRQNALTWRNMQINGFEDSNNLIFAIFLRETDGFIGGVGLHFNKAHHKAELGYWIAEPFWGKGYASEAAIEALRYGFDELNLNKIYATHFLFNPASEKVLQKIGMKKEADLQQHYLKNGKFEDVRQYALLKKYWV